MTLGSPLRDRMRDDQLSSAEPDSAGGGCCSFELVAEDEAQEPATP